MADTALPALLSLASHELRQPTGVVRGHLRMLDRDPALHHRFRQAVDEAIQAADRIVSAGVDKHTRGWEKPSDHVPVWVEAELD